MNRVSFYYKMGNCTLCSKESLSIPKLSTVLIPDNLEPKHIQLSDFNIERQLGKGSFGKVLLVTKKDSGRRYAMKAIKKQCLVDKKRKTHAHQERDILAKIKSKFVVRLHYAFQNREKLFLVLDFMQGGDLYFHLRRKGKFSLHTAQFYAAEVLSALIDLHKEGIIYRDLKPENILLSRDGHIKLADFNLAKHTTADQVASRTVCGTPEYIAPETLQAKQQTIAIDYWGFGVFIYEMLHGYSPFFSVAVDKILHNVVKAAYSVNPKLPDEAKAFISALLRSDPLERATDGEELKRHGFFKGIDWAKVATKEVDVPFRPQLSNSADLSCFTEPHVSDSPSNGHFLDTDPFKNFSFIGSFYRQGSDAKLKDHQLAPDCY